MDKRIEHNGIIKNIKGKYLIVSILSKASCLSCQLKGVCSTSEVEEKEIEVLNPQDTQYNKNDKVKVYYQQELGFFALFLGYIFPFLLMIITLFVGKTLGYRETIYGLASIIILLPYYLILYLLREKIKNKFRFSIEKRDTLKKFKIIND